ncbi:MAG: SLC13 family permease [Alphaproteobacteria bacterium]
MTFDIALVLSLLLAVMVFFSFEWLSVDVVTLGLIAILVLTGILTPPEAFSGFANEVIIILASVFVISGTLIKTGGMDWLAQLIYWSATSCLAFSIAWKYTMRRLLTNSSVTQRWINHPISFTRLWLRNLHSINGQNNSVSS